MLDFIRRTAAPRLRYGFWGLVLTLQAGNLYHLLESEVFLPVSLFIIGVWFEAVLVGIGLGASWEEQRVCKWMKDRSNW